MAKRTVVGKLALWALVGGCALAPPGFAQGFEIKRGFLCRIELPSGEDVDTVESAKICADSYVSITCRTEVDPAENPETTQQGDECSINTAVCGDDTELQPVEATRSKLTIAADGTARLNCLFELTP